MMPESMTTLRWEMHISQNNKNDEIDKIRLLAAYNRTQNIFCSCDSSRYGCGWHP